MVSMSTVVFAYQSGVEGADDADGENQTFKPVTEKNYKLKF